MLPASIVCYLCILTFCFRFNFIDNHVNCNTYNSVVKFNFEHLCWEDPLEKG